MVEGKSTHPLPLTASWRSRISCIHAYIHVYMHTYMHICIHAYIHTYIDNYPEFDQMSGKHLAQQIRNIKTKKLITEYENRIDSTSEIHHVQTELQEPIEQMEQDPVIIQQQEHIDNEVEDSTGPGINEYLTQRWKENFEKYISKSVDDRECSTTISPPPSEKLLNAMDKVVEDQVEEIDHR